MLAPFSIPGYPTLWGANLTWWLARWMEQVVIGWLVLELTNSPWQVALLGFWRNGPLLEAAAWAENVPFNETRDYVKKVLANTTMYAAILTGQPQSLKARLGMIGPRDAALPQPNTELP